jgi:general secretion pathway protein G
VTAARAAIANFHTALGAYRLDVGDYPSTAEGLQALRMNPGRPGWDGPYMPRDIPLDPWGVPYGYVYEGGKARITASHLP